MKRMAYRAFAESPNYCGLQLSPLIAAVMDASEGVTPTTIGDAESLEHFGCVVSELPDSPPRTVAAETGGRVGKTSRWLATKALHAAWTVDLPTLRRGEVASALLVAPDLKLARQILSFVVGYVEDSKILTRALVEPPTKDSVEFRRPDGKRVRVEVLSASRGGRSVRGRTLVFAGLDEACFFYDETSGIINDADVYRAVLQRVVPGGQVWIVSTPWLADVGLLEAIIGKNWGCHEHALVARGGTRAFNPSWDPSGEIERDLRAQDPDAAAREIDGLPTAGGAGTFFDASAITACVDETIHLPMPAPKGAHVSFGADLGFVSDSSALVGAARTGDRVAIVSIDEIRPTRGSPLKPGRVIDSFAAVIEGYGGNGFTADGHYRESAKEHMEPTGLRLLDAPGGADGKFNVYVHARKLIHEGRVRLPNHARLLTQLRTVVARDMPGGGVKISIPRRRGAGHGDVCSAFVLALWAASRMRSEPRPGFAGSFTPGISCEDRSAGYEGMGNPRYRGNY